MPSNTLKISPKDSLALRNEPVITYTVATPTARKTTALATPVVKNSSFLRGPGKLRAFKQAVARTVTSVLAGVTALITALSPKASTSALPEIYLNGQLENVLLKNDSLQLGENIRTGEAIVRYVQANVPCSPNYPRRTETFTNSVLNDSITVKNGQALLDIVRETPDLPLSEVVEMIEDYGVGNCEEMSSVGLKYARDTFGPQFPIERFAIHNGDHIFLVIGRDPMSEESDYRNWGSDAVICDPWTGACFPATDLERHLYNYVSTTHDEIPYTVVSRFNPATQALVADPVMG